MIARTTKWAIETNFFAIAANVERRAAFDGGFLQSRFCLELIDVDVTGKCQGVGGKAMPMLLFVPDR